MGFLKESHTESHVESLLGSHMESYTELHTEVRKKLKILTLAFSKSMDSVVSINRNTHGLGVSP